MKLVLRKLSTLNDVIAIKLKGKQNCRYRDSIVIRSILNILVIQLEFFFTCSRHEFSHLRNTFVFLKASGGCSTPNAKFYTVSSFPLLSLKKKQFFPLLVVTYCSFKRGISLMSLCLQIQSLANTTATYIFHTNRQYLPELTR